MKILAQRRTHISAVATVLLITKDIHSQIIISMIIIMIIIIKKIYKTRQRLQRK